MHQFHCPLCQGVFRAEAGEGAARVVCPHCQAEVSVRSQIAASPSPVPKLPTPNSPAPATVPPPPPATSARQDAEQVSTAAQGENQNSGSVPRTESRVAAYVPPSLETTSPVTENRQTETSSTQPSEAKTAEADQPAPTTITPPSDEADVPAEATASPAETSSGNEPPVEHAMPETADEESSESAATALAKAIGSTRDQEAGQTANSGTKSGTKNAEVKAIQLQDRPRTITYGNRVVELRRLTPEEKARQRLIKNLVVVTFSVVVLLGYLVYHLKLWPFG